MKNLKKIIAVMLSLMLVAGITTVTVSANTTENTTQNVLNYEIEPNNYFTDATELKEKESVIGELIFNDRIDVYKITLVNRSKVTLYQAGTTIDVPTGVEYSLYKESPDNSYGNGYSQINKEKCSYYQAPYNEYYEQSDETFYSESYWWSGFDQLVLDKGTYFFVFESEYLNMNGKYRIMFETDAPEPVLQIQTTPSQFDATNRTIKAGEQLLFKGIDANVKKWSSSNKKILKVGATNGRAIGLQNGSADVIATLDNGKELKCKVTVSTNPKLTKKGKTINKVVVKKGNTVSVKVEGKYYNIKNTYKDNKVAKIISNRNAEIVKIKGNKVGETTVKIKVNGVKPLKLKVKVKAK